MRAIANAVAQYKLDYSEIPSGGLQPMADIAPALLSVARTVPTEDAWGNELYYEEIVVAGSTTYRVYCYGKEGVPDGVVSGNWVDFHSDTVLEGGLFIQSKY